MRKNGHLKLGEKLPPLLIACSHALVLRIEPTGCMIGPNTTHCTKYDDESSDLTINLLLTWYKRTFLIGQLEFLYHK